MNTYDVTRAGNRMPVWQGIGQTWVQNISPSDALAEVGGNFVVEKAPLFTHSQTMGKVLRVQDRYAIVNTDNGDIFGECGSSYNLVQRTDLCRLLDDFAVRWPLETMGMSEHGKTLFAVFNAGLTDIGGDEVVMYFMIIDTIDGGTATKSIFTPIRVACSNALLTGMNKAVANIAIRHAKKVERDTELAIMLMHNMANAQAYTMGLFSKMAETTLSFASVEAIFNSAYKMPNIPTKIGLMSVAENDPKLADFMVEGQNAQKTFDYYVARARALRKAAWDLLSIFNSEHPQLANTAWAVYNVVVELADWRDANTSTYSDALFGQRAAEKKHAFAEAILHI